MLHYFDVSLFYVALFDIALFTVALFTVALSNIALCKCCTIVCFAILILYYFIVCIGVLTSPQKHPPSLLDKPPLKSAVFRESPPPP